MAVRTNVLHVQITAKTVRTEILEADIFMLAGSAKAENYIIKIKILSRD